jgi:hypothetical protein
MPLISSIFSALERLGSQPVETYTFARGPNMWRVTNAGKAFSKTYGATTITYDAAIISRGRLQRNAESGAIRVHITLGRNVPVARALVDIRMAPMFLGIHRHQTDPTSSPILLAYGNIAAVSRNESTIECDLVTGDSSLAQPFPRGLIERTCQWTTYSGPCGVDEAAFSFDTTIAAIDRSVITVAAVPGGIDAHFYDAGQLKFATTGERVVIGNRSGTGLKALHIFGELPSGINVTDAVTLIAGDDRSLVTCRDRFNNVDRFLGFDLLPTTDPMQTGFAS